MIKREQYLKQIREFYDTDLIKIITGIRRCGKSVILDQIKEEISLKSNNILYLNFEDKKIHANLYNADLLIDYINEHRKKGKCYIFLDEIQMVDGWAEAVKTLRLYNSSIFITGSNSKLLSKEFTKQLSGRYVAFRIRPLVYKEILEYAKELKIDVSITDYLIWGGFPKRFEFNTLDAQIRYLSDLEDAIVLNDLISRYNIKKIELFKSLVRFITESNSRIISAKSIQEYVKNMYENCSINTIIKYISYLEEAYIIEKIRPYSSKKKSELKYYYKIYNEDVCFNSLKCMDNKYDLTHNLENIIYNELIYMGYNVNVFNDKGLEVDFLANKNGKQYYIQVAYSIVENKTYEREFRPFKNLDNNVKKIIITNDDVDYSTSTVTHIKLKDFLLMNSLEEL